MRHAELIGLAMVCAGGLALPRVAGADGRTWKTSITLAGPELVWASETDVLLENDAGTCTVLLGSRGGLPQLRISVVRGETDVTLEDVTLEPPDEQAGLRWRGWIGRREWTGRLNVFGEAEVPDHATFAVWTDTDGEDGVYVEVSSTLTNILPVIRLCESALPATDDETGDRGTAPGSWFKWYCGCRSTGNMTLCPNNTFCSPYPARQCPGAPTGTLCRWFFVWFGGVTADEPSGVESLSSAPGRSGSEGQ